jgi:hypothetical protein
LTKCLRGDKHPIRRIRTFHLNLEGIEMNENQQVLEHFFAVTQSGSLYRVYASDDDGRPGLEKLALVGESEIPAGHTMKGDISDRIGLMHDLGIAIYYPLSGPHNPPRPDLVTVAWSEVSHTSHIAALFLEEADAREFLDVHFSQKNFLVKFWENMKNPGMPALKKLVQEMKAIYSTLATLAAIGDSHPRFVLDSAFAGWLK